MAEWWALRVLDRAVVDMREDHESIEQLCAELTELREALWQEES